MKTSLFLALLSMVLIAADEPKAPVASDSEKLQGTWQMLEEYHGDRDTSDEGKHCQITFEGKKFTVKKDDTVILEGTFEIDATKSPPQMDITVTKDAEEDRNGQKALGIYKLEGDKLKWCICEPSRNQRPTELETKGTDFGMFVLERAKK